MSQDEVKTVSDNAITVEERQLKIRQGERSEITIAVYEDQGEGRVAIDQDCDRLVCTDKEWAAIVDIIERIKSERFA